MEFTVIETLLYFLLIFITIRFLFKRSGRKLNLPPSPAFSFPVIGHLHLLKPPIHRRFLSLSLSPQDMLPYSTFALETATCTSHALAEECFTKNDIVLSDRPELLMGKHVGYNSTNMLSAASGDHWRNLRRIATIEILSSQRLNAFLCIRKDEIQRLMSRLSRGSLHVSFFLLYIGFHRSEFELRGSLNLQSAQIGERGSLVIYLSFMSLLMSGLLLNNRYMI